MNAIVCALHKMKNGGYLGGTACDFFIRITETQVDMENFLAGGAHLLWNYTVSICFLLPEPTVRSGVRVVSAI